MSRKLIAKVLREERLLVRKKRKFKPITTQSKNGLKVYPNRIKKIKIRNLNQAWVADITYIPVRNKFVHLCAVMDLCSRKIVAFHMSDRIDTERTHTTLLKAFKARNLQSLKGLILHSDRGVQYASKKHTQELLKRNVLISMSRKANWSAPPPITQSTNKPIKFTKPHTPKHPCGDKNIAIFISEVCSYPELL